MFITVQCGIDDHAEYTAGDDFADSDGQHHKWDRQRHLVSIAKYKRYDQYIGQDRRQRCKEFVLTAKHVSEDRSKQSGKTTENNIRDDASA